MAQRTASITPRNSTTTASPEYALPPSVMHGVGSIRSPRSAQPCWGAVVGGARAVLRSISRTRRGNGLDQTLAETEIEQLDVRIDAEL